MLVNYYYVCIRKLWKLLRKPDLEIGSQKKPQKTVLRIWGKPTGLLFPVFLPTGLSLAPLQALLPYRFMQRLFMFEHGPQPGCIVDLTTCDRRHFRERLA
jgi:hypothetical protein